MLPVLSNVDLAALTCLNYFTRNIRTNHSIQDAAAFAIHTPVGTVMHTGDFKVDYTPVYGDSIDLWRLAELGKKGILAVMCDSTNALRPGYTMSEKTVGETFEMLFAKHSKSRIIVATFASNVDRVQQVINTACKYKRKVIIEMTFYYFRIYVIFLMMSLSASR